MKLKEKLRSWMIGRYGIDTLFYYLFGIYVVIEIVNLFLRSWVLSILGFYIMIYSLYRVYSKKTYQRYQENQRFLKYLNHVRASIKLLKRRLLERKNYRFRTCPHCHQVLRLPFKKGTHLCECPRCHHDFTVKIRL